MSSEQAAPAAETVVESKSAKLKVLMKKLTLPLVGVLIFVVGMGAAKILFKSSNADEGHGSAHAPAHKKDEHAAEKSDEHDEHGKSEAHAETAHKEDAHGDAHKKDEHATDAQATAEKSHADAHAEVSAHHEIPTVDGFFHGIKVKIDSFKNAHEENARLRLEIANLRMNEEIKKFNCQQMTSEKKTKQYQVKLNEETGNRAGRSLASILYRPPADLQPSQLHVLALSYFQAREYEKSAVIFTYLTGLENDDTFRTPKNLILTGISWYNLDHFKLAGTYFQDVLKAPTEDPNLKFQAHARLWLALCSDRMGEVEQSQTWLVDLVDHHRFSKEASWVNPEADVDSFYSVKRKPAAAHEAKHEAPHEQPKGEKHEVHH